MAHVVFGVVECVVVVLFCFVLFYWGKKQLIDKKMLPTAKH